MPAAAAVATLDAELALWLPDRAPVRRELLRISEPGRRFVLRPDASAAGVELVTAVGGFHAVLSGPERADLEVRWELTGSEHPALPAWALVQGDRAEACVWDAFGRLVIPDLIARGVDANHMRLPAGRYVLTACVQGCASMVIGVGVEAAAVREGLRHTG